MNTTDPLSMLTSVATSLFHPLPNKQQPPRTTRTAMIERKLKENQDKYDSHLVEEQREISKLREDYTRDDLLTDNLSQEITRLKNLAAQLMDERRKLLDKKILTEKMIDQRHENISVARKAYRATRDMLETMLKVNNTSSSSQKEDDTKKDGQLKTQVCYSDTNKGWNAYLYVKNKRRWIGTFPTHQLSVDACQAAIENYYRM